MNRSEVVTMVSDVAEVDAEVADKVVGAFLDTVVLALAAGENVNLRRFGRFEPRQRAAVTRPNPRTGVEMQIPEKVSVGFVPSVRVKQRLNRAG